MFDADVFTPPMMGRSETKFRSPIYPRSNGVGIIPIAGISTCQVSDVLNRIHTEPEQDTYIIPFFFLEKRTPVASMHMFDAVRKLGHPTPHREQKKTSPKKRREKEREKPTRGTGGSYLSKFWYFLTGTI